MFCRFNDFFVPLLFTGFALVGLEAEALLDGLLRLFILKFLAALLGATFCPLGLEAPSLATDCALGLLAGLD